jgi:hypothetical protein
MTSLWRSENVPVVCFVSPYLILLSSVCRSALPDNQRPSHVPKVDVINWSMQSNGTIVLAMGSTYDLPLGVVRGSCTVLGELVGVLHD